MPKGRTLEKRERRVKGGGDGGSMVAHIIYCERCSDQIFLYMLGCKYL